MTQSNNPLDRDNQMNSEDQDQVNHYVKVLENSKTMEPMDDNVVMIDVPESKL